MFTKTAAYYDALYHFKDYEAAAFKIRNLADAIRPESKTLLDVACGTGKHLFYLKKYFAVEGLDLDSNLIEVARERCLEVNFYLGDMTNFHTEKKYDVVTCLFSSIGYVRTTDNLNAALKNMSKHLNPGGLLIIEPWLYPSQYWHDKLVANFYDSPDLKIAWMYKQEVEKDCSIFNIHYMVASPEGISEFTENHVMGLWTDEAYQAAFRQAGIENIKYDKEGFFGRGVYYGIKSQQA